MSVVIVELGLALLGVLFTIYYYITLHYNYWESRGIKGPKPVFPFGTVKDIILSRCCMGDYLHGIYKDWKNEPVVGIYTACETGLVINDLELIKNVLIKDFSKFADRGIPFNEKVEPLMSHLFNIESKRWRPLRANLSPVFTSGKLKEMFYLLIECANQLEKYLDEKVNDVNGTVIEFNDFTSKFTTDVIGVCVFGLQINTIAREESTFRKMGRQVFRMNWKRLINFRLRNLALPIYNVVGYLFADRELENFFISTTKQTMDYRKKHGVIKHDFVDLLMSVKDHPDKMTDVELTESFLAAQLFVFFLAGFETSSSTMSNALYELARNQEIQDKLRNEIKEEMKRTGGVIEYEGIKSLKYLDMVFQETVRMYPSVNFLTRKSTEPYTFKNASNSNLVTIEKGQMIYIPLYGIQRDPEYFPEPEVFNPERFTPEVIKSRRPMTYFPFGDGPRNCIGKRFGVMQSKVGLVKILHRCKVDVCEETQIPYANHTTTFLLTAKNGIKLKVTKDTSARNDY